MERISANIAYEIREGTYTSPSHVADALRAVNSDPTFRADFSLGSLESARIARYTLATITNFLAKQATATGAEQVANPDAKQVNLEHVLPKANPPAWQAAFSAGNDSADYIYRIGNLTLLLAKPNDVAADKSFTEKKRIALDGSTLKINEYFRSLTAWNDEEIGKRQDSLAKTALEVWKL